MKKVLTTLLLATVMVFGTSSSANATQNTQQPNSVMYQHQSREQIRKRFEERLNLTDKQKEKARAIHQQGKEEMKPIMMQIEVKHQEIESVKLSRIAERAQKEKIEQLNSEIKDLEKQAQEIRKKNSKEFEKILNKKQKAELEKMKAEGRARYEQFHRPKPPFQGLGTPNFLFKQPYPPANNKLFKN